MIEDETIGITGRYKTRATEALRGVTHRRKIAEQRRRRCRNLTRSDKTDVRSAASLVEPAHRLRYRRLPATLRARLSGSRGRSEVIRQSDSRAGRSSFRAAWKRYERSPAQGVECVLGVFRPSPDDFTTSPLRDLRADVSAEMLRGAHRIQP